MTKANEYGIYFSTTVTENGTSKPVTGDININNGSSVSIQGNVRTTNGHSAFDRFYIPASLHMEFDVSRQVTIGLKGEMDFILNREELAPKNLIFGLATLRYNFVPGKAKKMQKHIDSRIASMDAAVSDALRKAEAEKVRADRADAERQRLEKENAALKKSLNDCQQSKPVVAEKPEYTILFDNNSSFFSKEQGEALKAFAEQYKGKKLSLVAEASKPGSKEYNQRLSERRLERVVKALEEVGFAADDLKPSIAIGAQRGIDSAEARRVTITVE